MSFSYDSNKFCINFQLNGGIMDETPASNFYPPSPYIGANLIANGHITNAQCKIMRNVNFRC